MFVNKLKQFSTTLVILFTLLLTAPGVADIAIAGASARSIAISTQKYENDREYYLEIKIQGVNPKNITLEPNGQMLVLEARQGNIKRKARAGSQEVFYTFSFGEDAQMNKLVKLYSGNTIKVSIPKK